MRQKKIFKRRQDRHPVKWTLISAFLFTLAFSSFSAGVQFGQMGSNPYIGNYADLNISHETMIAQTMSK